MGGQTTFTKVGAFLNSYARAPHNTTLKSRPLVFAATVTLGVTLTGQNYVTVHVR